MIVTNTSRQQALLMKIPKFSSVSRIITGSLIAAVALVALPNAAHADRNDSRGKSNHYEKHDGDRTTASVQRALARRGYYKGSIDGDLGRGTRAAIARYQKRNGLRVTGDVNRSLLRSLKIS
jgi:peptidoglycan hydrolase-like protein with peptidoglycan-binding domain